MLHIENIICIKCGFKYIVKSGGVVYTAPDYTCPKCGWKINGPGLTKIAELKKNKEQLVNLRVGDILKVDREIFGIKYYHYGVYAGDNRIIHFTNYSPEDPECLNMNKALIQETGLYPFALGNENTIEVDNKENSKYSREKIVERARSRIGDMLGEYNILKKNCEHFANWCRINEYKCNQKYEVLVKIFLKTFVYYKLRPWR